MSKKIDSSKQSSTEHNAFYRLAAGDRITFYCKNVADGNVVGKGITNTFSVAMGISYSELDQSLFLVSLSGDAGDAVES